MKKLIAQAIICLLFSLAAYLLKPVVWLHMICVWGVVPAIAAVTAYFIVFKGVNPYAAWCFPPVMLSLGAYLVSGGFLPGFAAVLLTAFTAVAGAAFADTRIRFDKKKNTHKKKQ